MKRIYLAIAIAICLSSCQNDDYSPKPRSFYRIEFPEKKYQLSADGCPYSFEIPAYATITDDMERNTQSCWKNVDFPQFNAKLHLSYFDIDKNVTFAQLTEDARTFVFKHTAKATSIDQKKINKPADKIYGLEYFIQGNTASNYQFYVSDSTQHYLRGALYFNEKPNLDSIKPVLEFLKMDIEHLISTIRWK